MKTCPNCERRIGHLVYALAADAEDRLDCQECQERLPEYFLAHSAGHAGDPQWHDVALHLKACPHCAEVYADVAELITLDQQEPDVDPIAYPPPQLPFLHTKRAATPRPPKVPWRLDEIGRLMIEFSAEIVRTLQWPALQPIYAITRHKADGAQLWQIALADAPPDLEVMITAQQARGAPGLCTIVVQVDIPSRGGWPHLAGSVVMLNLGEQALETQATDAFGKAVFNQIAVDDLGSVIFKITPVTRSPDS
jgi:hypothetical protein